MKDRVMTFIASQHLTKRGFEKKCGLSNGYLNSFRNGFGADKLRDVLAAFPQLNRNWLLFGEGEMLKDHSGGYEEQKKMDINDYLTDLIPLSASGKRLSELKVSEQIISPIANVDFAIGVYGDSMAPEYPSGSQVLIKKVDPSLFIEWGKVYVLDTPNGVVLKEIHECKDREGFIICHSVNPDPKYADFEVPLSEVYGMYRVLMCLSVK